MVILGLGTGVAHDSSACLVVDGRIIAGAEEERFTRRKHQEGYPRQAIAYCLDEAGLELSDVDHVAIHFKPWSKFFWSSRFYLEGLLREPKRSAFYLALEFSPKLLKSFEVTHELRRYLRTDATIEFVDHHLAHAASCFFVSPFEEAAILTLDNRGERYSATLNVGRGNRLERLSGVTLPHSLGMVYAAITGRLLGFGPFDEYKVMGLASYGEPRYLDVFRRIITIDEPGSFRIDRSYFRYEFQGHLGDRTFRELGPARQDGEAIEQRHKDIAASLQRRLEEVAVSMAQALHEKTGSKNLCLAGGVALNGVMNQKILDMTPFENVYIQPAASDGGCSLGAAFYRYHEELGHERTEVMSHASIGPSYSDEQIEVDLGLTKLRYHRSSDIANEVAERLACGEIVGWFQGRMEWGPRALGNRSILADPRVADMKDQVNRSVKYREEFRPFAPSVLSDRAGEFFELDRPSPFMNLVAAVRESKRELLPAVTHVDGTARVQTVERESNPLYYDLIKAFGEKTGTPVVLNTSFNVRGEPIVRTPLEAIRCFHGTGLDALAIGSFLLTKK